MAQTPDRTASAIDDRELARSLYCRQCGYNLRGLRLGGQCPECGLDVWETVVATVDPAASRLPRLNDPRGVGLALVWLVGCLLLATLLMLARPVALRVDETFSLSGASAVARFAPPWLMILAGGVTLAGLLSVWRLTPTGREDPRASARDGLRRLAVGLSMIGLLSIVGGAMMARPAAVPGLGRFLIQGLGHVLMVTGLIIVLLGLRGLLRAVGERSREYRTARAGRQRSRDMIYAGLGLGAGELVRLVGVAAGLEILEAFGTVVLWISTLMLVIGLFYVLVNVAWICRSLSRPPPTIQQLLEAEIETERSGGPEPDEPGRPGAPGTGDRRSGD
ncbi:MAG: hypothetical protein SYC29_14810 [Planctomycetota bacterium]|nr:hypothetical protein [Planctomycetota bacterium]